jgi:hypothetical protein
LAEAQQEHQQLLAGAVARNAAVVLSLPGDGLVRHFLTRFIGDDVEGIWVELVTAADAQLQELSQSNQLVAGSFHAKDQRVTFFTTVAKLDPAYKSNDQLTVPAVCLRHPTDIRSRLREASNPAVQAA